MGTRLSGAVLQGCPWLMAFCPWAGQLCLGMLKSGIVPGCGIIPALRRGQTCSGISVFMQAGTQITPLLVLGTCPVTGCELQCIKAVY